MSLQRHVLLVDDHPVALAGLRLLVEQRAVFAVCGEASDATTARRLMDELRPDLVVLDLRLGGRDGLELVEDLHSVHGEARILIFSDLDELRYAPRALRAGAAGFVAKANALDAVHAALERLAKGEYAFSAAVQRAVFDAAAKGQKGDPIDALSDRELQILRLLGEGRSTADIAADLHLGMKTVGTYRERLKEKLKLKSARELEEHAREFVRQNSKTRNPGTGNNHGC